MYRFQLLQYWAKRFQVLVGTFIICIYTKLRVYHCTWQREWLYYGNSQVSATTVPRNAKWRRLRTDSGLWGLTSSHSPGTVHMIIVVVNCIPVKLGQHLIRMGIPLIYFLKLIGDETTALELSIVLPIFLFLIMRRTMIPVITQQHIRHTHTKIFLRRTYVIFTQEYRFPVKVKLKNYQRKYYESADSYALEIFP